MSTRLDDISVELDEELEEKLRLLGHEFAQVRILKKSIDARRKKPHFVYSVELLSEGEAFTEKLEALPKIKAPSGPRPIVIGAGPAGLFCALRLAERGWPPILLERGSTTVKRLQAISQYWRYGKLDPENNVCFGEGGAGLYSDGKLITRIRSPYIPYVMDRLIQFGAPEEIRYLSNPHVGSDRIRKLIVPLREYLIQLGCEIRFDTRVDEILTSEGQIKGVRIASGEKILSNRVVLATGHSASDLLENLSRWGIAVEGKSFAMGLRIEHSQKLINQIQFGAYADHPSLGAASYRLADHDPHTGIGVYSFCMCPGGYVVASTAEPGTMVSNGMSNYKRNSPFANSGIVITVDHEKMFGSEVYGGFYFRREIETKAFEYSKARGIGKEVPAQKLKDFLSKREGSLEPSSSTSGVVAAPLHELFPKEIYKRFVQSLQRLDKKMPGFLSDEAQLHAVESRTSCPIRVPRHSESLQSISHAGLYPCGEGAGYAGGITSAAVDGIRVAEAMLTEIS